MQGFVLRAEDSAGSTVGSWYIPYLADTSFLSESRYLACSGRAQSAVTHSGQTTDMWVVSFQWRPDTHFSGWVQFRLEHSLQYIGQNLYKLVKGEKINARQWKSDASDNLYEGI